MCYTKTNEEFSKKEEREVEEMKKYGFGVDVGGTTCKIGLFENTGVIVDKWEIKTNTENNGASILDDIVASLEDKLATACISKDEVEGIGIGVPGPVRDDSVVCSNGAACVITFQAADIKKGQRLYTNSGCAAMGYGLPAAVGASVSEPDKRIICVEGDGSFMMNMQELQTIVYNNLDIKIFLINNNGYHSIRQTQTNLFKGQPYVGIGGGYGLSTPDFSRVIPAFDIPYYRIDRLDGINETIDEVINHKGPVFCEVVVDWHQNFAPKSSSKVLPDGKIVSAAVDDMAPFLDREEYESNHLA